MAKKKPSAGPSVVVHCAHTDIVDVTELVPNPRNPNRHTDEQIRMLAKIIAFQGWRNPIVVSKRSGFMTKGHGRLAAALLNGWDTVPVDRQDYATEADEWADMVADNRIAELADPDAADTLALLADLGDGFDSELLGFNEAGLVELQDLRIELAEGDDNDAEVGERTRSLTRQTSQ